MYEDSWQYPSRSILVSAKVQNEAAAILHTEWPIMTDLNSNSISALYQSIGHVVFFQHVSQRLIAVNQERNNQWWNDRLHCSIACWEKLRLKVILPLLPHNAQGQSCRQKKWHKNIYSFYICRSASVGGSCEASPVLHTTDLLIQCYLSPDGTQIAS